MITHSPFILSDIQSKNILALVKTGATKGGLCTFGANIHDLLKTSFLHDSVIGDYAQWMINRIIICLQVYQSMDEGKWNYAITSDYYFLKPYLVYRSNAERRKHISFNREKIEKDFSKEYLFSRIKQIDEPIIRTALWDEYAKVFKEKKVEYEIAILSKRIEELKKQQ